MSHVRARGGHDREIGSTNVSEKPQGRAPGGPPGMHARGAISIAPRRGATEPAATNVEAGSFDAWQREQRGAASSAEGEKTS